MERIQLSLFHPRSNVPVSKKEEEIEPFLSTLYVSVHQKLKLNTTPLSILALGCIGYSVWVGIPGPSSQLIMSGFVAVIAAATMLIDRFKSLQRVESLLGRRVLAASLIAMMLAVAGSRLIGANFLAFDPYNDWRYAAFLSIVLSITMVGLLGSWFIARWIALALAIGALLSSGLNLVNWIGYRQSYTWGLTLGFGGALLIIANLGPDPVRRHFELHSNPMWSSSDPILQSIRRTVLSFLATIPMLLVYGWVQPIVPQTSTLAIILAVFLIASVALVMTRKLIGAIGLATGGIALFALTVSTSWLAYAASPQLGRISLYYAAFWIPAGMMATLCGGRLLRPTLSILLR